jgi:hypothetical protein
MYSKSDFVFKFMKTCRLSDYDDLIPVKERSDNHNHHFCSVCKDSRPRSRSNSFIDREYSPNSSSSLVSSLDLHANGNINNNNNNNSRGQRGRRICSLSPVSPKSRLNETTGTYAKPNRSKSWDRPLDTTASRFRDEKAKSPNAALLDKLGEVEAYADEIAKQASSLLVNSQYKLIEKDRNELLNDIDLFTLACCDLKAIVYDLTLNKNNAQQDNQLLLKQIDTLEAENNVA